MEAERMIKRLEDFVLFEERIPQMALADNQKQALIPILQEWKEKLDSNQKDR